MVFTGALSDISGLGVVLILYKGGKFFHWGVGQLVSGRLEILGVVTLPKPQNT